MPDLLLSLRGGSIGYGSLALLSGLNFNIKEGEFWGIVGPNGAGKSTLLKTLIGTLKPVEGVVSHRSKLRLGYVPQRSRLDPMFPLSSLEVVMLGRLGGGRWRRAKRGSAHEALERLGVADLEARPFRSLSGGQQQRVLMARALVRQPEILVLDEPTAGMDLPSERDLLDFVEDLNREQGTTVLLVVHHIATVACRASHLALLNAEQGKFAIGPTAEMISSARLSTGYQRSIEVLNVAGETIIRAERGL